LEWRALTVAEWSGALLGWERELASFKERLGSAFGRAELRRSAGALLDGLLSGVSRKAGWLLAEQAGLSGPYRMQSLPGRGSWSAEGLRDMVRSEVLASPHDALHGRPRLPGQVFGRSAPRRLRQPERNQSARHTPPAHRRLTPAAASPSVPELRYLLARLLLRSPVAAAFIIAWSHWRQRHQRRAARPHYHRQPTQL